MHTLLIVDDQFPILASLAFAFRRYGFHVIAAGSGPDALKIIETTEPDAALIDINMPEMDGFALCRALRRRGSSSGPIAIWMMSGGVTKSTADAAVSCGARALLTKPFDYPAVAAEIQRVLSVSEVPAFVVHNA